MCRQSFSWSPSHVATRDINPSADTHAGAVMCPHDGVSADTERWMTRSDVGSSLNRKTISSIVQFGLTSLAQRRMLPELQYGVKILSSMCCR